MTIYILPAHLHVRHGDGKVMPDSISDLHIRRATGEDIEALLVLEQSCHAFPWSRQQFFDEFANPAAAIDVALQGEQLVGYLCSWLIDGELQIQNLATSPSLRRRGIGQMLLEYVINRSRDKGLESAWLEVHEGNQAAIGLYRGYGFVVAGRRKKYYQDGGDALVLNRNF